MPEIDLLVIQLYLKGTMEFRFILMNQNYISPKEQFKKSMFLSSKVFFFLFENNKHVFIQLFYNPISSGEKMHFL